jgi:hypothetical protein
MANSGNPYPWDRFKAKREYDQALEELADRWVPGANGTEVPGLRNGRWTLYVFNPGTRQHGYLDLATDVVEVDPKG